LPNDDAMLRLEVLRMTLETGSAAIIANPLEQAEKNLQWVILPVDKPQAQLAKPQSKKPGQAA
tara:strand:+ start:4809 stop:4997 length:189 start_codon:yes stop_codon:yes gene_type:complete